MAAQAPAITSFQKQRTEKGKEEHAPSLQAQFLGAAHITSCSCIRSRKGGWGLQITWNPLVPSQKLEVLLSKNKVRKNCVG